LKIEMDESLVRSWLRHIEACQFAELNCLYRGQVSICNSMLDLKISGVPQNFLSYLYASTSKPFFQPSLLTSMMPRLAVLLLAPISGQLFCWYLGRRQTLPGLF